MTGAQIRSLTRRQLIMALKDDLAGGELLMKEVWEECETSAHQDAAKQELAEIIAWLKEREESHCDTYVDSPFGNSAARWFIFVNRLPASLRILAQPYIKDPKLFADYQGKRVRVVMASRLGNLGITYNLAADYGYQLRVAVDELTNFSGEA